MSTAFNHGYLPAGKYIINHDIMNCTADGVVGNHLYSARGLGLSEPWDIIQLHPDLEPLFNDISAHYHRVGLSHSTEVIWNLDLKNLGRHIGYQPSVFYFGPTECRYWGDQQWLKAVEYINSKNNFIAMAESLGVAVPSTICLDKVADLNEHILSQVKFPCYVKASISVSGVGIFRCENIQDFIRAVKTFADSTPVQIQENLDTNTFLNLQYQVIDGKAQRLTASEQILDGFAHQGNRVPAKYEPWTTVDIVADKLVEMGMKGVFAFDIAVLEEDQGVRFSAIECNPRFNGATYPTMIAKKLNIPCWSAVSLSSRFNQLSDLKLKDLEFNASTGQGIVIINWGIMLTKKISILLAGSTDYQQSLLEELEARI